MEYRQNKAGWLSRSPKIDAKNMGKTRRQNGRVSSSEMEVAKLSAPPNLEVRFNESATKRCLSSELEERVGERWWGNTRKQKLLPANLEVCFCGSRDMVTVA